MTAIQAALSYSGSPSPPFFFLKKRKALRLFIENTDCAFYLHLFDVLFTMCPLHGWHFGGGERNGEITDIPELFLEMESTAVSVTYYIQP